jgi:hypothetical protein
VTASLRFTLPEEQEELDAAPQASLTRAGCRSNVTVLSDGDTQGEGD